MATSGDLTWPPMGTFSWPWTEGVPITMPLTEEEWGERAFQVRDPNGIIIQLVERNAPAA